MKTEQKWKICDCFDGLPELPDKSVDMILTDLPYGITACSWDNTLKLDCLWAEYRRIINDRGAILFTASQPFTSILVMSAPDLFKYCWVWIKTKPSNHVNAKLRPMGRHEDILVFSKGTIANCSPNLMDYYPQGLKEINKFSYRPSPRFGNIQGARPSHKETIFQKYEGYPTTVLEFSNPNNNTVHPTQKPLELWEYLIKTYTNEGDTVHDSCLGSGTTLEACMNLNRNCMGFEIDPQWEPIYRKRLKLDNAKLDAYNDHETK